MVALVHEAEPDAAILGEEVGPIVGTSNRRWIVDGIDGTHNFAEGRAGWGTIVTLEIDGVIELGLVTAPVMGRRWWAERGAGAWTAPFGDDGRFDPATVEPARMQCSERASLDGVAQRGDPLRRLALRLARRPHQALPVTRHAAQHVLRDRHGIGGRGRLRRGDHHQRRAVGPGGDESDRARGGRRVPRRVGRPTVRHHHRDLHQPPLDRPGARRRGDHAHARTRPTDRVAQPLHPAAHRARR